MKLIGILGGMSAASTALYYDRLNLLAREKLGPGHSANLLIRSVDFAGIAAQQAAGDWPAMGARLNAEARRLELAGAELLVLATNTMHKLAAPMMAGLNLPLVHIADATAEALVEASATRPGLMATAYTMEQSFYTDRLRAHGLDPVIPGDADRAETHRIIYDELVNGLTRPASRQRYEEVAQRLVDAGADALILGCTEVGMLLNQGNVSVPVFDTTLIHCDRAFAAALS